MEQIEDSVGIALATYNGEAYIAEQLESLINQDYRAVHIYIHDDGSTDRTLEVIKRFCLEKKCENKVSILEYPAQGSSVKNFLSILNYIHDNYIMYCDQDDIWLPFKVQSSLEILKKIEGEDKDIPACVYTDLVVVDDDNKIIDESCYHYRGVNPQSNTFNELLSHNIASGNTVIFNRALSDKLIGINIKNIPFLFGHDGFTLMIARIFGRIAYYDRATIRYRQHRNNQLGANRRVNFIERIRNHKEYIGVIKDYVAILASIEGAPDEISSILSDLNKINNRSFLMRAYYYRKFGVLKGKDLLFI